jgi:hypothetical protein
MKRIHESLDARVKRLAFHALMYGLWMLMALVAAGCAGAPRKAALRPRSVSAVPVGFHALFGASIYRGKPLLDLVDRYLTDELLRAVAAEAAWVCE